MARSPRKFGRDKATREPKRRFLIYCEGENTEPGYFRALRRHLRSALIEIEVEPTGAPITIAERAVSRARSEGLAKPSRKRPANSYETGDQVWAVFDRDEHEHFNKAVALCEQHGVQVGRSNPCFEIWLILHFEEFDRQDDRHQVCRHLRSIHPEYDPNGAKTCDWAHLIEAIAAAERRAQVQLVRREQEGFPFGTPSTTVGVLTQAIRDAANASKAK